MSLNTTTNGACAKWNDATVFGDTNCTQYLELLNQPFPVLAGHSSRQKEGTWRRWAPTYQQLLDTTLTLHRPVRRKDGAAIVFAEGVPNGDHFQDGQGFPWYLAGRTKNDIASISLAGFDIDNGASLEAASEKLKELGIAGSIYSTHSHGKRTTELVRQISPGEMWNITFAEHEAILDGLVNPVVLEILPPDTSGTAKATIQHDPIDKFRVVLPLASSFTLMPHDKTDHDRLCEEWRKRASDFGDHVLGLGMDSTGCDVNRLFYTPRHKPGEHDWFSGVYAGRPLTIDEMKYNGRGHVESRRARGKRGPHAPNTHQVRPILSDGFDLIDWRRNWGHRFLAVKFLEMIGWELRRGKGADEEATIECANEAEHSNAGDPRDMACWTRNGDGSNSFALSCRHEHCSEVGALEHLALIEQQLVTPEGFETLSHALCRKEYYLPVTGEVFTGPNRGAYLRWDATNLDEEAAQ